MSIGEELRQAREQMKASLLDVENETKIRTKYIIAMENDAFDVLPGKVYVKGFLRMYARFLGLDGEALVDRYDEQLTSQGEDDADEAQQSVFRNTKLVVPWKGLAVAALALLLIALIYQGGAMIFNPTNNIKDSGQRPGTSDTQNNTVGNQDPVPDSNKSDVVQETKGIDMVLQVIGGESWMRVVVDNESVFEGTVGPNNVKQFTGRERIWVKFGNAGVVKVRVNGKDYGFLDGPGQVVTRTFTEKDDQETAGG